MVESSKHTGKCKCHHLPKEGKFTVGNTYEWTICIDGKVAIDENGKHIAFGEIEFLWYFVIPSE